MIKPRISDLETIRDQLIEYVSFYDTLAYVDDRKERLHEALAESLDKVSGAIIEMRKLEKQLLKS